MTKALPYLLFLLAQFETDDLRSAEQVHNRRFLKADQIKKAAQAVMNGEKGFKELGPSELDRINKNAFLTFEALFPSMVMPREEITAIVNHELELSRQPSRTTLFGKYEIQELFERIVKEMEFRWNLDERFKPPHWNQRPRIPTIKQDNVPPVNPNDKDDAILSNTKSND